ncbi:hypothetical protein STEG23_029280 [Scotinomys teguina]
MGVSLRGKAVVLMRKKPRTCIAIQGASVNFSALEKLLPLSWENVGFVLTIEDLTDIRDMLLDSKVQAAAHAGAITLCEVTVPAQNTVWGGRRRPLSSKPLGIASKGSRAGKDRDKMRASKATLQHVLSVSPSPLG